MVVGTMLLNQFAAGAGLMAAGIAVGGFIFHAGPALAKTPEEELRPITVAGGLFGLAVAIFVIVLSA
jgi:hypothetical protein